MAPGTSAGRPKSCRSPPLSLPGGRRGNFPAGPGSNPVYLKESPDVTASIGDLRLKARVSSWSEVSSREAALIERCAAGDETACAELVDEHQRMVFQLALNLLGDRDEALDLSQEIF